MKEPSNSEFAFLSMVLAVVGIVDEVDEDGPSTGQGRKSSW